MSSPSLPATTRSFRRGFNSSSRRRPPSRFLRGSSSPAHTVMRPSLLSPSSRPSHQPSHNPRRELPAHLNTARATSAVSGHGHGVANHDDSESDDELAADANALNEVIMAIDMKNDRSLGCAYYIASEEKLYLLEDVAMAGAEVAETLLLYANPTTVLTPARTAQELTDLLNKGAESHGREEGGQVPGAYLLRLLSTGDFSYDAAVEKLIQLELESAGDQSVHYASVADDGYDMVGVDDSMARGSVQGLEMRLGASINLQSRMTVGCAGAVLSDIHRRRTAQYLPDDPDARFAFRIRSVETFTLFDSMFVNADTLASLQILKSEFHPNCQVRGPGNAAAGAKESLSVFGLIHSHACTPEGRANLRKMFLRPSNHIELIRERHRAINFFLRPDHVEALKEMTTSLRKIKNMRPAIGNLQKGVDNLGLRNSMHSSVWHTIQLFALHALSIRETVKMLQVGEGIPIVQKIIEAVDPQPLRHVADWISSIVDFEQSKERGRTAVRYGVDKGLDEYKREYEGMDEFLNEVMRKLRLEIPEWAQRYLKNCLYLPQIGFLIVVSQNPETGKGNYEGEGLHDVWEQLFTSGGDVYYKNKFMRQIDETYGDAYCKIIDLEIEILHKLTVEVLQHEELIMATSSVLGELDSLLALAKGSRANNWVAPRMTTDNVLIIEEGFHPLQKLLLPSFIGNDCYIAGGGGTSDSGSASSDATPARHEIDTNPSTLILTGPNHSGKSVYLKQVALIVYLAHIGCFVPAERAEIGLTDRILTRVATRESVASRESAFAIDLRQAAFAVNFATRRSLILVDEFGKGTNSLDGVGIVTALLDHFTSLGPERPKLLAATHFHEIFENHYLVESPELRFAQMDVRVDLNAATTEDQVTYLFKLRPGRSVSSFGSRCAAMNGVDQTIIERAEAIMLLIVRNEDLEAACATVSNDEALRLESAEDIARDFLQYDLQRPSQGIDEPVDRNWYHALLRQIVPDM